VDPYLPYMREVLEKCLSLRSSTAAGVLPALGRCLPALGADDERADGCQRSVGQ